MSRRDDRRDVEFGSRRDDRYRREHSRDRRRDSSEGDQRRRRSSSDHRQSSKYLARMFWICQSQLFKWIHIVISLIKQCAPSISNPDCSQRYDHRKRSRSKSRHSSSDSSRRSSSSSSSRRDHRDRQDRDSMNRDENYKRAKVQNDFVSNEEMSKYIFQPAVPSPPKQQNNCQFSKIRTKILEYLSIFTGEFVLLVNY